MVVIILISILAIMAVPAMATARDDRMAFDYARQFQAIIHRGEIRAMARGAAHLVLIDRATGGTKGRVSLFEAVDATPAAAPDFGPKPVSSCRGQRDATGAFVNHWAGAEAWTPGAASPALSPLIDNVNLDSPGVERGMNLFATIVEPADPTATVVALCYTPGGNVYEGYGTSTSQAVAAMRIAAPFNRYFEVEVARHDAGGTAKGLKRRIFVAGGSAPRISSQ